MSESIQYIILGLQVATVIPIGFIVKIIYDQGRWRGGVDAQMDEHGRTLHRHEKEIHSLEHRKEDRA